MSADKGSDYCISAGAFARLCGTTRDTLRYYHQQGILVPHKDPKSGYHYYSAAQIASYYFISTFRQLDCSAADIREYLLAGQQQQFDAFVEKQHAALLAQRAELDRKIQVMEGTRELLSRIRQADVGEPCLQTLPPWRFKATPVLAARASSTGQMLGDVRRHLADCARQGVQAFPMGAAIAAADFLQGEYHYASLFSFAAGQAQGADILALPGGQAAVCVCRDSDGDIRESYQALAAFLRRRGLSPRSDLYSLSMVNVIDPQQTRRYLKYLFICAA